MVEAAPKQPLLPESEMPADAPPPDSRPATMPPAHGMPGRRADLPANALPKPCEGVQGDENREPPDDAPSPVPPPRLT